VPRVQQVLFDETSDPAGDVIDSYRVSVDTRASVGALVNGSTSSDFKTVVLPVTHRIQKVTVDAHFAPISGAFTLAFGGFHGDLTRRIGGNSVWFNVASGASAIVTTTNVDLTGSVLRGDYILIGTEQFRVCTAPAPAPSYTTATSIPLCSVGSSSTPATFRGIYPDRDLVSQPAFSSDTTLGRVDAAQLSNFITTFSDFRGSFTCGDLLQIGDTDQLYRTSVALCASNTNTRVYLDRTFRHQGGLFGVRARGAA
jgi:hypothetical protein